MPRPTVVHCVPTWVADDAGSLLDVIAASSATRPLVVCRERRADGPAAVRSLNLDARRAWMPRPTTGRRRLLLTAAAVRWRARLIHVHDAGWAPVAMAVARRLRLPLAVTVQHEQREAWAAVPGWIEQAGLVVVTTPAAADSVVALGVPADKVRMVDAAVDLARWPVREPARNRAGPLPVLHLGDDEVAGLGDSRDAAVVVVHRPILDTSAAARRAVIEAQASGIPVLVAGDGAASDAVGPGACIGVGTRPDEIASVVTSLADDPERRADMGRQGRRHAALHHEVGRRAAELEGDYAALVAGRPLDPVGAPVARAWPSVSVVIPSYNRRRLLASALDALEAQTYPAELVEVVVVDNGSSDDTMAELRGRTAPWKLTVLRNEVNASAAAARNQAVERATGEVIAFTDSDCRPDPTWLEALVAGLDGPASVAQGCTVPDAERPIGPLARSQSVPWEYGLYETCNIAYDRAALRLAGDPPFRTDVPDRVSELLGPEIGRQAFGEDADLAWRAKRNGARSRFASRAVVRHHVFDSDFMYRVHRAALLAGFPVLVGEVPELRRAFLRHRVLLGPDRVFVWAAVAGLATGARSPRRLVLALPWLLRRVQPLRPGARERWRALPRVAAIDAVATAALVYGSARTGRVVL